MQADCCSNLVQDRVALLGQAARQRVVFPQRVVRHFEQDCTALLVELRSEWVVDRTFQVAH